MYYDLEMTQSSKHLAAAMRILLQEGVTLTDTYTNDWGFAQTHRQEALLRIKLTEPKPVTTMVGRSGKPVITPNATAADLRKLLEPGMKLIKAERIVAATYDPSTPPDHAGT